MQKRLAVFGSSFNPPGQHHCLIAQELARHFDAVIVVPCGPRPDKPTTDDVDPVFRAVMTDLTFSRLANVRVELFDLELSTFTRTHKLQDMYQSEGEVWHVVGVDLIQGGQRGQSIIHRKWERGEYIWHNLNFAVVTRAGYEFDPADLPPKHKLFDLKADGASELIREKIYKRQSITGLVTPVVERYIERYGLYRGRIPSRATKYHLEEPRLLIVKDERNARAHTLAEQFQHFSCPQEPNCILVIGGDGMMQHAIRDHWRRRLPFFGINAGHLGFLLNNAEEASSFPPDNLILRQLPLLYVETEDSEGRSQNAVSFNDAWVERATSQTAWIEVKLNGHVRVGKLIADGVLVSTAAGSTAYARAMGATPLLVDTPALTLVGSNVLDPPNWKSVLVSLDSELEFSALEPTKRPLNGFASSLSMGQVRTMRVRVSRVAAVELAFCPSHDMAEKIAEIQFPKQKNWQ